MALRTIAFLIGFVICAVGSLFNPLYGIVGYIAHYLTWPEMQWWGDVLNPWGVRYSLTFAAVTALGIIFNASRLRFGRQILTRHEMIVILFFIVAYVTDSINRMDPSLNPAGATPGLMMKLFKVFIFVLMLTHVVTDVRRFRVIVWVMVLGALYLGVEAYNAPVHKFYHSRLNDIGGPDFGESSFFGAHLVAMLPFIGIFFLCGTTRMKVAALAAGAFVINAIVLTRTRAALVGVCAGLAAALVLRLRKRKLRMVLCLLPTAAVAYYLTDAGFWQRMNTITEPLDKRERSSASRVELWKASLELTMDHPFGVGAGNFPSFIGQYDRNNAQRDAHNTFLRCAAELGIQSALLLGLVVISSWVALFQAWRGCRGTPHEHEIQYYCYAVAVCQFSYLASGMFMTTLFIEEFWWFLMLPVCLMRCADNARAPAVLEPLTESELYPALGMSPHRSRRPLALVRGWWERVV